MTIAGLLDRARAGVGNVCFPALENVKADYPQNTASEWQLKAVLGQVLPNHGQNLLTEPHSAAGGVLSGP